MNKSVVLLLSVILLLDLPLLWYLSLQKSAQSTVQSIQLQKATKLWNDLSSQADDICTSKFAQCTFHDNFQLSPKALAVVLLLPAKSTYDADDPIRQLFDFVVESQHFNSRSLACCELMQM